MTTRYETILKAEQAIDPRKFDFGQKINAILAAAEDNATDSKGRVESIICLLSFPSPDRTPEVIAWFSKLGVKA